MHVTAGVGRMSWGPTMHNTQCYTVFGSHQVNCQPSSDLKTRKGTSLLGVVEPTRIGRCRVTAGTHWAVPATVAVAVVAATRTCMNVCVTMLGRPNPSIQLYVTSTHALHRRHTLQSLLFPPNLPQRDGPNDLARKIQVVNRIRMAWDLIAASSSRSCTRSNLRLPY